MPQTHDSLYADRSTKNQDHYAVLGLSKYRFRATEDQIKRAHRKKVLRHHPDKKAASGKTEDDSFFKCIQKATEILLDPVKRQQWDSVDEGADVEPPSKKQSQKGDFFKLWNPVFEAESRFSKKQPVPQLGGPDASKDDVEGFYDFWSYFESWRTFEYEDEDVPDDNENRDQKRHVEKKNANARRKKKTEDTARLNKMVQDVMGMDPRLAKFKKEKHAEKNKARFEREAEAKRVAEEAAKKKEEEAKLAAEAEEKAKAEKADSKKAKEAAKNAAKKNKRVIRGAPKEVNYFADKEADAKTIDKVMNDVDVLIAKWDNEELADATAKLTGKKDASAVKAIFVEEVQKLIEAGKLKDGELTTFS